ncbi:MAG: nitrite reductase small subunit [Pseudomonadota bacterium]|jgi:nitrite reductase (NADH) small subunit
MSAEMSHVKGEPVGHPYSERMREVCTLADLPVNGARKLVHGDTPIALFRTLDDALYAIEDRCPHKGGPLSEGMVVGAQVSCPLHNWTIDLASGEAEAPDHGCVRRFACELREGKVYLDVGH